MSVLYRIVLTFVFLLASFHAVAADGDKLPARSVLLIPAADPVEYTVTVRTAATMLFPIASLGALSDGRQKSKDLTGLMRAQAPGHGLFLAERVAQRLRAAGYAVRVLEQVDRKPDDPDNIDVESLTFEEDIGLHLQFDAIGFHSGMGTSEYVPKLNIDAYSFPRGAEWYPYSTTLFFGVDARPDKEWAIVAPAGATFPTYEALIGNPASVDTVYRNALDQLAERVVAQFQVQSPLKPVP
ncbi:hypothetical protein [uncultured Hydrogenophaga sp.]|jgi:hypothetical protein|uniref:hypothetical protein n=1 Tax=uncultured Hydrogenophaga sp. TaxID=199683 RepID=UPI00258A8DC1|nr:hypothetical protein [uncultured Hydrogenophaga sp.]